MRLQLPEAMGLHMLECPALRTLLYKAPDATAHAALNRLGTGRECAEPTTLTPKHIMGDHLTPTGMPALQLVGSEPCISRATMLSP